MTDPAPTTESDGVDDDEPPPARPTVVPSDERQSPEVPVDLGELARLLAEVLHAEGAGADAEASLTLVDTGRIAELKREHLDGDGSPTDVLSFPVDGTAPDAELVGDVVVCPTVAAVQAGEHAGTVEDELALLVVHGGLHLAGWDHAEPEQRRSMWARERELLRGLGRLPARDPWTDIPGPGGPTSRGADR